MPSPFIGMDPYLEGYLWPDVHHSLASQVRDQLMAQIRPKYVARIEIQVVVDETPEGEIGIMYPDVELFQTRRLHEAPPLLSTGGIVAEVPVATTTTISVPLPEIEARIPSIEIRDTALNQLVTSIEILSPVNKREPGLWKYRAKRRRLHDAGVHIVEIDLLRRGQRTLAYPRIPESPYRMTLTRALSSNADIWAVQLGDPLPTLPVPLRTPDADVLLDLGLALRTIYERAAYDLSINYDEPPPPPALTPEQERLRQASVTAWRNGPAGLTPGNGERSADSHGSAQTSR